MSSASSYVEDPEVADLARRAAAAAGAHVHDVKAWTAKLRIGRLNVFTYTQRGTDEDRRIADTEARKADRAERVLRAFLFHGDIHRAERDIPDDE